MPILFRIRPKNRAISFFGFTFAVFGLIYVANNITMKGKSCRK